MATLYWGGGSGTWDGFSVGYWYTDAGRTTLSTRAPCATDDVVFDSLSSAGSYTVTISGDSISCKSCTISGPATGTMTLAGSGAWYLYGSLALPATGLTWTYVSSMFFYGAGTKTITTNGVTVTASLNFFDGTYVLQDSLNTGAYGIGIQTGATLDTNNQNLTCGGGLGAFAGTTAGTLLLRASTVVIGSFAPNAPLTVNAGTSNVTLTSAGGSFGSGINYTGNTFYNVTFSSTAITTANFYGNNTFNSLTFAAKTTDSLSQIVLYGNVTVNGTLTLQGSNAVRRYFVRTFFTGKTSTLTVGSVAALTDVDFRDIAVAGASAPWSGTRLGNCGGNSNISFPAAKTVYWNNTVGGLWSSTSWAASSGGAVAITNFPLPQDTAIINDTGLLTGRQITSANYNVGTITSTKTNAYTLSGSPFLYGDLTLTTGMTATGFSPTFAGRATQTLSSPVVLGSVAIAGFGASVTLGASTTITTLTLTSGGLNTNGQSLTTNAIFNTLSFTNLNAFSFTFGSSNIVFTGSFGASSTTGPAVTLNAGASTVNFSSSTGAVVGLPGNTLTWNNVLFNGAFTAVGATFYGTNTFANLSFTYSNPSAVGGASNPIVLGGNVTVTGTLNFGTTTLTARRTVRSDYFGRQRTLSVGTLTGFSYIDFMDIVAAGTAAWSSGTSIGDCGNNSGITFTAPKTVYWNSASLANWYSTTPWASTSGGVPPNTLFPLPQDTAVFDNAGAGTTVSFGSSQYRNICTLDASARTTSLSFSGSGTFFACGDIRYGSGATLAMGGSWFLQKRGVQIYDTLGKSHSASLFIPCSQTTVRFASAVSVTNFYAYSGTLDTQNFNLTVTNLFTIPTTDGILDNDPLTLNFGTSTVTLGGSSSNTWGLVARAGLTVNAANATFLLTSASAKTFAGGGYSYGALTNSGNNPVTVTGSNTIGVLTTASSRFFIFAAPSTQTLTKIVGVGSAGSQIRLYTNVPGQQVTFVQSATGTVLGAVGANSVDGGNTSNLFFAGSDPNYLYIKDVVYSGPDPVLASPPTFLLLF